MGLFNNLKDAVKKTVDEKKGTPSRSHPAPVLLGTWTNAPQTSTVQVLPNDRKKMYVYYPEVLSDLPDHAMFVLEAMPLDAVLTSYTNGTEMNSLESDAVVFARGGRVVGASFCYRDLVRQHVMRGRRVLFQAEKAGMFSREIPDVYIYGTWDPDGFRELRM